MTIVGLALVVIALPAFMQRSEPVPPARTPTPGFQSVRTRLENVSRLTQAVAFAVRRGDSARFVATKDGRVFRVRNGRTRVILDIRRFVKTEGEAGLVGLTFTPDGRRMVIDYVARDNDTRIRSYQYANGVDVHAGREMLRIDHPDMNFHHSGNLAFGPDGYLYVSHGDGGIPRDPKNRAQSLDVLLGKILRLDVRPDGSYKIPKGNPFVGKEGARPEIWDMGFRNAWRFSFDAETGDLWIGDVGLTKREEIDFEPAGSTGGRNYGWSFWEGTNAIKPAPPPGLVPPRYEIEHNGRNCAVIGGYVYRGFRIPGLRGAYLFGDLCTGRITALRFQKGRPSLRVLPGIVDQLTSFGQDDAGELYVLSLNDGVFRIDPD